MTPKPKTRRRLALDRQQVLILVIGSVMIVSYFLVVLLPKHQELVALGSAVLRERDSVNQKVRASHEGLYVSARISALRKVQETLDRRLPSDSRVGEFLDDVARCVQAEPDVTHEMQRTETSLGSVAPAVPLRLRLKGPFDGVYRCLAAIEGLDRITRFCRLHVSRLDGGKVVADAEVLVYYLPLEDQPHAADESNKDQDANRSAVNG
jgi:Tfp pilus assembly protein PilO